MGLLDGLFNLAIDVVRAPLSIISDCLEPTGETKKNVKDIADDIESIFDDD